MAEVEGRSEPGAGPLPGFAHNGCPMTIPISLRSVACSVLLLVLAGSSALIRAQDTGSSASETAETEVGARATLPYRHLMRIAQSDRAREKDAESYRLRIASSIGTAPEKIRLVIDSREGAIPLLVDDQGFFEVPNTLDLLAENPLVVTNQPRGTLNISVSLEVPPFDPPEIEDGKVPYRELFGPLIELQEVVRKVNPTFGLPGNGQLALSIETDQPIRITRDFGTRTFRPKDGIVLMVLEAYLLEENPVVEIPGKVEMNLRPVTDRQAEEIKASY